MPIFGLRFSVLTASLPDVAVAGAVAGAGVVVGAADVVAPAAGVALSSVVLASFEEAGLACLGCSSVKLLFCFFEGKHKKGIMGMGEGGDGEFGHARPWPAVRTLL